MADSGDDLGESLAGRRVPATHDMTTVRPSSSVVLTLARKELATQFNSPATYVVFVVFMLVSGWLFVSPFFQVDQSNINTFIMPLPLIFTFLVPALTMRSFAEEFRGGTIE